MAYVTQYCKLHVSLLKNIKFGFYDVYLPHPLENGYFCLKYPSSKQPAPYLWTNRIQKAIKIEITFKINIVKIKIIKI